VRRLALAVLALLAAAGLVRQRRKPPAVARIVGHLRDQTVTDEHGAVRSVQSADVVMPTPALEAIWTPMQLERIARTYWRFLSRVTLGLVRVVYTETTRTVVFITLPFRLLRFQAPEYEMDERRGIVRWRIEDGILVAARGEHGDGYLEIDIERCDPDPEESACERLHVEIEVSNFYPAISFAIGRWVYENTQSRIHVIICYAFLRSLVRLDLAESRVGRFATREEVPGISRPERPSERVASRGRDGRRYAAPSPTGSA
jgi:hypothetical protein